MSTLDYQEFFLFAAKAGALEGYLFKRRKAEPLTVWVDNIDKMYHSLSPEVKKEVDPVFTPVLKRILSYGARTLEPEQREKVEQMIPPALAD